MDYNLFVQTINRFDNGLARFNLGNNWSFLFNNKWYPTRAFMVEYNFATNDQRDVNLHTAVFELTKLFPVISAEITYDTHTSIPVI